VGLHYGAAIGAGLLVTLLITSKWWGRSIADCGLRIADSRAPKWFWPALVIATLLCLALRVPLASKSLWWDEAWVIQQVSLGRWKMDPKQPDKPKFQAHDWSRCAWYYQKPTNHVPMSLLQKGSITAWQKLTHAKKDQFSDLAARVPALAASCLAVLLLGVLLKGWGSPGAGIAAAFLLALHPWHIRYGVDARAYALVVPLCIGGMLAISRMVQSRGASWPAWTGWGICEFLWLWAYPNAVFDIAALNILAAVLLWKKLPQKRDRWTALFRLGATNLFAAAFLIQMFLPNLLQARHWAGQEADKHILDLDLAASTLSQLVFGREYQYPGGIASEIPTLLTTPYPSHTTTLVFVAAVLPVLFMAFFAVAWRHEPRFAGRLTLPALFGSSILFSTVTWVAASYFYPRFLIALLPAAIAAFCLTASARPWRRVAGITAGIILVVSYLGPIHFYLTRPYEPLHDVANFVQADSAKDANPPLVACYGLGREIFTVYRPSAQAVEDEAGVSRALAEAKSQQRPLYVIYGYNAFNRTLLPTGFKLLDDRSLFEELKVFPGIETEFYFHVLRAK
jgi:hypothetical protein